MIQNTVLGLLSDFKSRGNGWLYCSKHCSESVLMDKHKIAVWQKMGNQIFLQDIISSLLQWLV